MGCLQPVSYTHLDVYKRQLQALGYSKFDIAKKYLNYALLATLGGSVFGVLVGEKIFPYIIVYAYKIMYQHLPHIIVPYHFSYAIMATAAAVLCTFVATLAACYKELLALPAVLMRPPAPKKGKRIFLERITFIWKHLSFIWKSSCLLYTSLQDRIHNHMVRKYIFS